jgi:hypothetical protein
MHGAGHPDEAGMQDHRSKIRIGRILFAASSVEMLTTANRPEARSS